MKYSTLEKELFSVILDLLFQHTERPFKDKEKESYRNDQYESSYLSANSHAFEVLIEEGLATGNDLFITLNKTNIEKKGICAEWLGCYPDEEN